MFSICNIYLNRHSIITLLIIEVFMLHFFYFFFRCTVLLLLFLHHLFGPSFHIVGNHLWNIAKPKRLSMQNIDMACYSSQSVFTVIWLYIPDPSFTLTRVNRFYPSVGLRRSLMNFTTLGQKTNFLSMSTQLAGTTPSSLRSLSFQAARTQAIL